MPVIVFGLYTAGCVKHVVHLPMRADVPEQTVPALGTPRVSRDSCKSLNAHAWYEAHFIVIVLLDDGVSTAELPDFVLILHRHARGQIFA